MAELIQLLEKLAPLDFLAQLSVAEILRLVLEYTDSVHALVGLKQGLQLLLDRRRQRLTEQTGNSSALAGNNPPDHILQIGVPRGDDALIRAGTAKPRAE